MPFARSALTLVQAAPPAAAPVPAAAPPAAAAGAEGAGAFAQPPLLAGAARALATRTRRVKAFMLDRCGLGIGKL